MTVAWHRRRVNVARQRRKVVAIVFNIGMKDPERYVHAITTITANKNDVERIIEEREQSENDGCVSM